MKLALLLTFFSLIAAPVAEAQLPTKQTPSEFISELVDRYEGISHWPETKITSYLQQFSTPHIEPLILDQRVHYNPTVQRFIAFHNKLEDNFFADELWAFAATFTLLKVLHERRAVDAIDPQAYLKAEERLEMLLLYLTYKLLYFNLSGSSAEQRESLATFEDALARIVQPEDAPLLQSLQTRWQSLVPIVQGRDRDSWFGRFSKMVLVAMNPLPLGSSTAVAAVFWSWVAGTVAAFTGDSGAWQATASGSGVVIFGLLGFAALVDRNTNPYNDGVSHIQADHMNRTRAAGIKFLSCDRLLGGAEETP